MTVRVLAPFEFRVLATIARGEPMYGIAIWETVNPHYPVSQGALYSTLSRLLAKHYVTVTWSAPKAVRGGRRRGYYCVTTAGHTALAASRAAYASI
jgi:DNA-binding PadR family transcriptional regulator